VYGFLSRKRRENYRNHPARRYRASVPVIVVGNITAGGTGKTPLTLALAQALQQQGYSLGIVSRGHGGKQANWPLEVKLDTAPSRCGDEALILASRAACPVVVDPLRTRAVQYLEKHYAPQLILCDDGLQHYALERNIEIVVIDGSRGLGNGRLLPQGPLREPASRLQEASMVVVNGALEQALPGLDVPLFIMHLESGQLHNLASAEQLSTAAFQDRYPGAVHAVAGIGNPQRFYRSLEAAGFAIMAHDFPDHHPFRAEDLDLPGTAPVIMTEKDAVKCRGFAGNRHWYLQVDARLPVALLDLLQQGVAESLQALAADPLPGKHTN
jgi:tetraacyldisaccharide 4'-kinase